MMKDMETDTAIRPLTAIKIDPDTCRRACLYLEDMKQQLRRNANVRLACEMMALRLITASAAA